jgi:CHRD domain-containing protein
MMKPVAVVMVAIAVLAMLLIVSQPAMASTLFSASMVGSDETPAISTGAHGFFLGTLNDAETQLDYALLYFGLEGGALLFAHIHFGQPGVSGGVSAFLCGGGSKPAPCPASGGVVTGSIVAADVVGPTGQGISAGEFGELVRALKAGLTYANVHTQNFQAGEIRGQIK